MDPSLGPSTARVTSLLQWGPVRRGERSQLKAFTCTDEGRKVKRAGRWQLDHRAPWERYVQARIRSDAKPPAQPPLYLWAGRDDKGFGAVLMYEQLDGPHQVDVHYTAIATRYRGKGGGVADEMMRTLLDNVTEDALQQGAHVVQVLAWIHERNGHSQRMFRRFGFQQVDDGPENLQRWGALVLVGGAE